MSELEVLYPMLATGGKVTDEMMADGGDWLAQEKIDGSRYLMFMSSEVNRFSSRQTSRLTGKPVEKTENVPHLASMTVKELDGTILDGEIQHKDFSQTVSIMGSKPDVAIAKQREIGFIHYRVFDIIRYRGEDVTKKGYAERLALAEKVVEQINRLYGGGYIQTLPVFTENKWEKFHEIVGRDGEGLVLKHKDSIYVASDKEPLRSKMQIKLKKYLTDDVVIMGATPPTKYYDGDDADWKYYEDGKKVTRAWHFGWIGAIRFGKYKDEVLVELGQTSGIDDATKVLLSDGKHNIREEYIGQTMEIGAMEQIKKTGAYRHPRYLRMRPDKNAEECVL